MAGNSILTPSSLPPSPSPSAASVTVSVPSPPPALAILEAGATVAAQVVANTDDGMSRLEAVIGGNTVEIEAKLPVPLPVGATVSMRVGQAAEADAAVLRLASVNGRALAMILADPTLAARTTGGSASAAVQAQAAALDSPAAAPASTIGVGRPIPALVLRGDVLQDAPGHAAILPPGTQLTVRLTHVALPEIGGSPTAPGTSAAMPGAPQAGQAAATPQTGTPPTNLLPDAAANPAFAGRIAARYAAMGKIGDPAMPPPLPGQLGAPTPLQTQTPQAAAQPAATGAAQANPAAPQTGAAAATAAAQGEAPLTSLSGIVVGRTALGQPTVQTAAGFVALDVQAPLPNGTQVGFDVLARAPAATGTMVPLPPPGAYPGGANPWATLDALWQSLGGVDPDAAASLGAALPQPGPHLLANLAAAVAAVRAGDAREWLRLSDLSGRDAARSDARVGKLAQRFADDLREASTAAQRPAGEWRVYSLPFSFGAGIDRIHMVVRRAPDPENDTEEEAKRRKKNRPDVRFLLDLTLSRLGPMQLDGLVSRTARNLDLIIRTHAGLPTELPQALRGVFSESLSAVGYTGSLAFRVTPRFAMPEDLPADPGPGVVV